MKTIVLLSSLVIIVATTLVLGGLYPPPEKASAEERPSKALEHEQMTQTNSKSSKTIKAPVKPKKTAMKPLSAEGTIWNYLISKKYTRNQAAGIMGNLKQEHHYKTSNVAGGLGIAQWMGGRRDRLMARSNYLNLTVQLDFMIDELRNGYAYVDKNLRQSKTVEDAVIIFQDQFERCGTCMQSTRIKYAYQILNTY